MFTIKMFELKPRYLRERSVLQALRHKLWSHRNTNCKRKIAPAVQLFHFVRLQYIFLFFMCLVCVTLPVCKKWLLTDSLFWFYYNVIYGMLKVCKYLYLTDISLRVKRLLCILD